VVFELFPLVATNGAVSTVSICKLLQPWSSSSVQVTALTLSGGHLLSVTCPLFCLLRPRIALWWTWTRPCWQKAS